MSIRTRSKLVLRVTSVLVAAGFAVAAAQGCTLTVDTEELEAGDEGLNCHPNDEKICVNPQTGRGECRTLDVVSLGCDDPNCEPCAIPRASARCRNNICVVNQCDSGWADCDRNELSCEKNLRDDENNCGSCGVVCDRTNAINNCINGQCVISSCSAGRADCDGDPRNGCEWELSQGDCP